MKYAKSIEEYFDNQDHRKEELVKLRKILKSTELEETVKWGMPTYTLKGKNIVGIGGFKEWSCLWFHEGALLKDEGKYLINAQEGKTKALRQWRFASIGEIDASAILKYLAEAIDNHKKGLKVDFTAKAKVAQKEIAIPKILNDRFETDETLKEAFSKLTFAQKRDYCEYVSEPKREATKSSRMDRIIPLIKSGKLLAALWEKK